MFNDLVCNVLEVVFGVWSVCIIVDFLFDINVIEIVKKAIAKLQNEKR